MNIVYAGYNLSQIRLAPDSVCNGYSLHRETFTGKDSPRKHKTGFIRISLNPDKTGFP